MILFPPLRFLACLVLWLCCAASPAASTLPHATGRDTSAAPGGATIDALARHPTWLRLLHYDRAGRRSEINTRDFFLAGNGATDPRAELLATVAALEAPWSADPETHARCRFPARHFWLAQQNMLPADGGREPRCRRLERWAQFDRVRSVSLLMVSGYFGNPASSFGHALLKFNTHDGEGQFFDLAFNFGALVPENEWMLRYVVYGLAGGYESGFSDRHYYTQDLVYARTEFRDMWDYELALTEPQRLLLMLHLWEVVGRKFTYYFLTKNCAYRLAELMELVTGRDFTRHARLWYVPVELFHRLHAVDGEAPGSLIRSRRFIPSSQRVLYQQFEKLTDAEADTANALIAQGTAAAAEALGGLPEETKINIADAVLAYHEYRAAADPKSEAVAASRQQALRLRLRLPPRPGDLAAQVVPLRSPADAGAPMMLGAGAGWDERSQGYVRLRWAPFYWDLIGDNGLASGGGAGELVVLDSTLGIDRDRAFIERVDLIRARKLTASHTRLAGESALSWQLQFGWQRMLDNEAPATQPRGAGMAVARLGAGYANRIAPGVIGFAMLDGVLQSRRSAVALEPNAGLVLGGEGRWRALLHGGSRYEIAARRWQPQGTLELRWQVRQHGALRLDVTHARDTRAGLGYQAFF